MCPRPNVSVNRFSGAPVDLGSILVRAFGFRALLIHGDPLVLDRWLWLRRRLTGGHGTLLDVGSGNGAFTIGAARLGYRALGLTFQRDEALKAKRRAAIAGATSAAFQVQDIRHLAACPDLRDHFDVVLCFETIEHVLDDAALMSAVAGTLRIGGTLLLTTPSLDYRPIDRNDRGPWPPIEDGRHVRKGYSSSHLSALAKSSGLRVIEITSCGGFISQKLTGIQRYLTRHVHPLVGWGAILPIRWTAPLVDPTIRRYCRWPDYSVCMVACRD